MTIEYTATFKLEQNENGEVTPGLVFNPLVDPETDEAPPIYEYMANVALQFLKSVDLIDERLQWVGTESADGVTLELSSDTPPDGTVH